MVWITIFLGILYDSSLPNNYFTNYVRVVTQEPNSIRSGLEKHNFLCCCGLTTLQIRVITFFNGKFLV